jgi:hypothetical protein
VQVKTLHGAFEFSVQRLGSAKDATTWLEHTGQVCHGYLSERLAEFGAYYSNRLSYEEVARLIERVSGERVLSDQKIQQLVVAQAAAVSEQWVEEVLLMEKKASSCGASSSSPLSERVIKVAERVDWYDSEAKEVLLFADAIQVKRQKPERGEKKSPADTTTTIKKIKKRARVSTDMWLVEQPNTEFHYLSGGIDAQGKEVLSVSERVRWRLEQDYYGGRRSGTEEEEALAVVAITDGAKTIRYQLEKIFGREVPLILDWYHLHKKLWEFMSMVARNKAEKESHVRYLLRWLWRGQTAEALDHLQTEVALKAKNLEKLAELVTYLKKHRTEIIDYERRQRAGKTIGSGRMEKGVDQSIGARQKKKGMSWSEAGSKALGILKTVELNQQWEQLWFPQQQQAAA